MVVALWTLAGLAPGVLGYLVYQQWGPLWTIVFWVVVSRASREPKVDGIAGWLLPVLLIPMLHRNMSPMGFVMAQTLPRAAMAVLAWIGRPAAHANLPHVSTPGTILSIIIALVPVVAFGLYGAIAAVATAIVVRMVLDFSYRYNHGISRSSMGWTRQLLEIVVLAIARPGSTL
jgi:hypothetical protein